MIHLGLTTTIRIDSNLKAELASLKNFKQESFEDVIERLVSIAREDESLEDGEIAQIERSLKDIKQKKVLSLKDAEKKWGI